MKKINLLISMTVWVLFVTTGCYANQQESNISQADPTKAMTTEGIETQTTDAAVPDIDFSTLSVVDQIIELETRRVRFNAYRETYDNFERIYDSLYPENKPLQDEQVLLSTRDKSGITCVLGKELKGKSIEEEKSYIEDKFNITAEAIIEVAPTAVELSFSGIYKDKTLDWYYVFVMMKSINAYGETYIPSRYTLEENGGKYSVIEYNSELAAGLVSEENKNSIIKKLKYTTWNNEPVKYIESIDLFHRD